MYYTIRICAVQSVFAKQSLVSVAFHVTAEAKPRRSRPLINSKLRHQLNHTWKTTVLGKKIRSASGFLICDPRNPLLMSRFVMFFFIEDSAIRFSSCPFALELYYSLHSFCIFLERVNFFFFFCLHFHTLPVFFSFPLCFMLR